MHWSAEGRQRVMTERISRLAPAAAITLGVATLGLALANIPLDRLAH
ncbi:MAG: hypothetical protein ACHP9Z_09070 [Streptosporangiales bacterium]